MDKDNIVTDNLTDGLTDDDNEIKPDLIDDGGYDLVDGNLTDEDLSSAYQLPDSFDRVMKKVGKEMDRESDKGALRKYKDTKPRFDRGTDRNKKLNRKKWQRPTNSH